MYLKDITLKNILSYGEKEQTYQLDRYNTTLLVGYNGVGKSTIIESLSFCLYGKPFRPIPKQDLLINDKNKKGLLVTVNLIDNDNRSVKVIRGLKPSIFEVWIDGELANQNASIKEYQQFLETNIIGMNLVTFCQTVIISKTKYTPFMKMKTPERRTFVESVLNLQVYGEMQKIHAKKLSTLKKDSERLYMDMKMADNNIKSYQDTIKQMYSMIDHAIKESNSNNAEIISRYEEKNKTLCENIDKLTVKLSNDNPYEEDALKYTKLLTAQQKYEIIISNIKKELVKLNSTNDICHYCGNKVDISHIYKHIDDKKNEMSKSVSMLNNIVDKISQYKDAKEKSDDFNKKQSSIKQYIENWKIQIEENNSEIKQFQNNKVDIKPYKDKIDSYSLKLDQAKKTHANYEMEYTKSLKKIDHYNIVQGILKDSGIKASIIENSIETINVIISNYLIKFGFMAKFELDSEFNETIWIRGSDNLCYNSLSEGEKLRIDLALILAWRDIALLQNGITCNLIFFDEITDASMDNEGVEMFAKALNALDNTNSWIISHTPEKMESYVRGFIQLEKVDGFTISILNK